MRSNEQNGLLGHPLSVWPEVGIESNQIFPKVAQKWPQHFIPKKWGF